jgi:transposase
MDEVVAMSGRELDRAHVIRGVRERRIRQVQAAKMLGRSLRQVQRLCAKMRDEGPLSMAHGLRGRPSNHQLDPAALEAALGALHAPRWDGFGPTFARDKLKERCGITLGKERLRQLMIQVGLWSPKARRRRHRAWRPRRDCVGMLVQLDGSTHDWFEGRGPVCVLLIYIDDATSKILYGEFVAVEDTLTLLRTTRSYLRQHGRPGAFYVDRDSIYKTNPPGGAEEQTRDEQPMTQFTRAMDELGIEVIAANSPQAKGRVERGFDTHQDRLVKELRLRNISTMGEANRYLWGSYIPGHNESYAVPPASAVDAHRPLVPGQDLFDVLSVRIERVVRNDYTIQYRKQHLQIRSTLAVRPKSAVTIQTRLDGSTRLLYKGRRLDYSVLPSRPLRLSADRAPKPVPRIAGRYWIPFKFSTTHSRPQPWQRR